MISEPIIPLFARAGRRAAVLAVVLLAACGGSPGPGPAPLPLTLTCPADVQASSPAGAAMPVTFNAPVQSGGTQPVNVTCSPSSGTPFAPGSTPVTCTANDAAGRTASCAFGVNVTLVPQLTSTRFLSFGDSLTEGKLSLTLSLLVDSPAHSYPAKLLQKLRDRYTAQQQAIVMINEGFGGERAVDSIRRFRDALDDHSPEAVMIMHGVNDLNGTEAGRVQAAVDAIEELVKIARDEGLTVFVATLPPLGPGGKAGCPECVDPFNDRLRSMVAAKRGVLVDVHTAWGNRPDLMGADGIHPTEAGYDVIATEFFEAIRRTLEKPPATP